MSITITTTTEQTPLRQIFLEFQELTNEEEDLYFKAFCFFCGTEIESQDEYNNHYCSSKSAVKSYYQRETN